MIAQKAGAIVNTSSVLGRMVAGGGRFAHYGMAKAAIVQYSRALAVEVGPLGIRVNCIEPGIILTERIKRLAEERDVGTDKNLASIPLGRHGSPEDCANVVEFLVSDLSGYVTGQVISVSGGADLTIGALS